MALVTIRELTVSFGGPPLLDEVTCQIEAGQRIGLLGRNGSGKTTLLRAVVDGALSAVPVGYLPQRLDGLDPARSVLDNVRRAAPAATPHQIRARLARFLVRGDRVEQAAGTLSGGERFRVSLACLLLAEPPPQLLLLDEPTNNLDLVSVEQLVQALRAYRGALIVASHDRPFLARLGIARWWSTDGPAPQEVREP
jgi:ATPase subunit of ABC transporter with duplicated ATPase domains